MARADTTSTSRTRDPAKDLDKEVAALRDDIAAITATLTDIAKYRGNEAKAEVDKMGRKARQKGEETIEAVQHNVENAEDEIKTMIREKPITSVLVAAGVGYILSKVFRV